MPSLPPSSRCRGPRGEHARRAAALSAPALAAGPYLRLGKPRIAALSTLSAGAAFCLAAPQITGRIFLPLAGLFILACGSGALNQFQERALDARMPRTRRRPLPAGEIRPQEALLFAVGLMPPGLFLLLRGGGTVAAILGLAAVLWYNGVYTCLKKKTALALFPGALIGAIPPAIGWVSAGGDLADPRLLALCGFLFLWQVPHFGLLVLAHGAEYAEAGLPVLSDLLSRRKLARIVLIWILIAAAAGLLLPLPGAAGALRAILAGASLALVLSGWGILSGGAAAARRAFHAINIYLVAVLVLALAAAARNPPAALDNHANRQDIDVTTLTNPNLEGSGVDRIDRTSLGVAQGDLPPGGSSVAEMTSLTANRRLFP
jgi:heme o synthase